MDKRLLLRVAGWKQFVFSKGGREGGFCHGTEGFKLESNLVPRVLSYPPYGCVRSGGGGGLGENPGNEVGWKAMHGRIV